MIKSYFPFFTTLFFVCLLNVTYAQKDSPSSDSIYLKNGSIMTGTVVTNKKTILHHLEVKNPEGVLSTYSIAQIDSFTLENNERFIVKNLKTGTDSTSRIDQFIQILFRGEFSLLKSKQEYFFETQSGEILGPLQKSENTSYQNGQKTSNANNHKGILSYLTTGDCNITLKNELNNVQLQDHSMVEFLVKYHSCKGIRYDEFKNNQPKFRASYLAQAGLMQSNFKISGNSNPTQFNLEKSGAPIFLLGTRLSFYRDTPKLSMDILIGFSTIKNTINYFHESRIVNVSGRNEYTNHTVSANWFVNYSFFRSNSMDLYLGAGVINGLNFSKNKFSTVEYEILSEGIPITQNSDIFEPSPLTISPSLKLGSSFLKNKHSRLSIEALLDYTPNAMRINLTEMVNFNGLNYGFVLGYSFRTKE